MNPNEWLGRNIINYAGALSDYLVAEGVITLEDSTFLNWSNVKITYAGWYWKVNFSVDVERVVAHGTVALDVDCGETPAQIAAKLSKETLNLNYDWWNGKDLIANWAELHQMIVNHHLLTKVEASVVRGIAYGDFTVDEPIYRAVGLIVNDNNIVKDATPTVDVVNDGEDAYTLASKLDYLSWIDIPARDSDMYTDNPQVLTDIRQAFVSGEYPYYTESQVKYLYAPHQVLHLGPDNNIVFTFKKDDQWANTISVPIVV